MEKQTVKLKRINPVERYFLSITSMFRTNIRDYGMYIALIVIFLVFSIQTNWVFLSPRNFSKLLNQTAYVAVLAVGMVLVIVTRQIDLSVGFLGAFLGSFIVVSVENNGWTFGLAFLAALVITILVGALKGYFVAHIKVPSFVVTLAGMFIFKGLNMIETDNTTISTANPILLAVGNDYLPTVTNGASTFDLITMGLGIIIIIGLIIGFISGRRKNDRLGIPNEGLEIGITKLILAAAIVFFITYTLASFRGISYQLLIAIIVVGVYHFITTQTTLGRRIYAVGGNPEAAELSGINVKRILIIVFISMGILALIAGVLFVTRLNGASPLYGVSWELYAIAAAYIGGTSAEGGVGKVVNAVIGAVVIVGLNNGMSLNPVGASLEPIILGSVLLLSVVFDIFTRNVRPIDLIGIKYAKAKYKDEYDGIRLKYSEASEALNAAKKAGEEDLLSLQVEYSEARSEYVKIKEKIRVAKEEDFVNDIV